MGEYRHDIENFSQLEAAIRSAGDYVHPTDDLRPSTLEAAGERRCLSRGRLFSLSLTLVLFMAPMLGSELTRHAALKRETIVSSQDLQQRARQATIRGGFDPCWGLYEAFCELRREQAARFSGVTPKP